MHSNTLLLSVVSLLAFNGAAAPVAKVNEPMFPVVVVRWLGTAFGAGGIGTEAYRLNDGMSDQSSGEREAAISLDADGLDKREPWKTSDSGGAGKREASTGHIADVHDKREPWKTSDSGGAGKREASTVHIADALDKREPWKTSDSGGAGKRAAAASLNTLAHSKRKPWKTSDSGGAGKSQCFASPLDHKVTANSRPE